MKRIAERKLETVLGRIQKDLDVSASIVKGVTNGSHSFAEVNIVVCNDHEVSLIASMPEGWKTKDWLWFDVTDIEAVKIGVPINTHIRRVIRKTQGGELT